MLSTATSANIGFWQVVQLLAPPQTLAEKIPFINSEKKLFWVLTMCAQILGFSRVRGRVRFRVRVSIRISLVYLVCATTLGNNVAPSVSKDGNQALNSAIFHP